MPIADHPGLAAALLAYDRAGFRHTVGGRACSPEIERELGRIWQEELAVKWGLIRCPDALNTFELQRQSKRIGAALDPPPFFTWPHCYAARDWLPTSPGTMLEFAGHMRPRKPSRWARAWRALCWPLRLARDAFR